MAFDARFALGEVLFKPPSSATKSALLLPMRCASDDNKNNIPKATRHQSHIHTRLHTLAISLFDFVLQAPFHCPVVDGPFIDGAVGCVVFDDDVFCGAFRVWLFLFAIPPPRNLHYFCQCTGPATTDFLEVTQRISTPSIARCHLSLLITCCKHPFMVLWSLALLLLSFP